MRVLFAILIILAFAPATAHAGFLEDPGVGSFCDTLLRKQCDRRADRVDHAILQSIYWTNWQTYGCGSAGSPEWEGFNPPAEITSYDTFPYRCFVVYNKKIAGRKTGCVGWWQIDKLPRVAWNTPRGNSAYAYKTADQKCGGCPWHELHATLSDDGRSITFEEGIGGSMYRDRCKKTSSQ